MIIEGEFFSDGHLRWNLGWPTPNYAGAFLATLLALLIAFSRSRWRWGVLAAEAGGLFLLAKTYSRGSVVALGLAWLFGLLAGRGWLRPGERWLWPARVGVLVLILLAVDFSWSRAGDSANPADGIREDGSVANRLALWQGGLRMIAAAPLAGWGAGESGRAYMNWYQEMDRDEGFATMVNSYLHVAVEHGLPVLMSVLFLLVLLVVTAWRRAAVGETADRSQGKSSAAVVMGAGASLIAWAVANVFTTLWIEPRLWVVPSLACLLLGWCIWRDRIGLLKPALVAAVCLSLLAVGGLYGAGKWLLEKETLLVAPVGHGVVAEKQREAGLAEWHVWPDPLVLGSVPGKEMRRWLEDSDTPRLRLTVHPAVSLKPEKIPTETKGVLLFGRQAARIGKNLPSACEELWIVHPTLPPPELIKRPQGSLTVVLPQVDEIGNEAAWRRWAEQHEARVVVSTGCGLDIRAVWPDVLKVGQPGPVAGMTLSP